MTLHSVGQLNGEIVRISEPIKSHWARLKGLNLQQLLGDGPYKERYRREMIEWSDQIRQQTPAFFCQEAYSRGIPAVSPTSWLFINDFPIFFAASKPIVIVSDIRRRTDIDYFRQLGSDVEPRIRIVTVRIRVDDSVRVRRGWTFQQGIDDVASECDLDGVENWDIVVNNEGLATSSDAMEKLIRIIDECL